MENETQATLAVEMIRPPSGMEGSPTRLRTAVPTALSASIDRAHEDRAVEYCIKRVESLADQAGRGDVMNDDGSVHGPRVDFESEYGSWMQRRAIFKAISNNDTRWRVGGCYDTIWERSNLCSPNSRSIARKMNARMRSFYFGTDPWFSVAPTFTGFNPAEADISKFIESFARYKIQESGAKGTLEDGTGLSTILGEAVTKVSYRTTHRVYKSYENVLINPDDAQPLRLQNGDYIFRGHRWIIGPDGFPVSATDGVTPKPLVEVYVRMLIDRVRKVYNGLDTEVIDFRDFLCPLDAPDIHSADFIAHLYDRPLMDMVDVMLRMNYTNLDATSSDQDTLESIVNAAEFLRKNSDSYHEPHSGARMKMVGEDNVCHNNPENPLINCAECYFRYDMDGDGRTEEVMMIVDMKNKVPIVYDYLDNVTPNGKRPMICQTFSKVKGRWYGMGAIEIFFRQQQFIDLQLNRRNFRQSSKGSITFWNPELTREGAHNPNLELNDGATYTKLNPQIPTEQILSQVKLVDDDAELMDLLQYTLQNMANESGVASSNDGQTAGLDSQKTATGIRNLELSAQEVFSVYIADTYPGIQCALEQMVYEIVSNLDPEEVAKFLGQDPSMLLDTFNPQFVRDMKLKVNIFLSKSRSEQMLISGEKAAQLGVMYYQQLPPVQERLVSVFRQCYDALGIQGSDIAIAPLILPPPLGALSGQPTSGTTAQGEPPKQLESKANL